MLLALANKEWRTKPCADQVSSLLVLLALAQVPLASATITYPVGTCKPRLRNFTSITVSTNSYYNVGTINGGGC